MLSHGDELGRTQQGNNNAYCQDNPLTWIDWRLSPLQRELLEFTREVFAMRAANPGAAAAPLLSSRASAGRRREGPDLARRRRRRR